MFPFFLHIFICFTAGHDGTFLVRRSKNGGEESPYALTIYYNENMFHINIRTISGTRKYALGKSKVHEMVISLHIRKDFLISMYLLIP